MPKLLSEKYRPHTLVSMIGNEQPRLEAFRWLKRWKLGAKPLLLMGPPGTGKSTTVYALAKEFGYTVVEYNASDVRTRENLRERLGPAIENASLFGEQEKLLVFLDEIDGLSGRADYAGMDFVLEFIEGATIPIAMAANVEDSQKLKKIVQKSLVLKFKPVTGDLITIYLRKIAGEERILVSETVLQEIAARSRGDVRQALNSLQTVSGQRLSGARTDDQFMSDAEALDSTLSSRSLEEEIQKLRQFDASPIEKIRSIFDAVVGAKNLSVESKAEALKLISEADILFSRINREQSWRLLRYLDRELALATFGRALKRVDSSIPWNLKLAIWNDGRVIKELQSSLASEFHVGKSDFSSLYLPYLSQYFRARPRELEAFLKSKEFGDSEKRVLLKVTQKA